MNTVQIWRHKTSGDQYVVEVDDTGKVVKASSELHYTEVEKAREVGVVNPEPEQAEWMNENAEDFILG